MSEEIETTILREKVIPFVGGLTNVINEKRWGLSQKIFCEISRASFEMYKGMLGAKLRDTLGAVTMLYYVPDDFVISYNDIIFGIHPDVGETLEKLKAASSVEILADFDLNFAYLITEITQANLQKLTDATSFLAKKAAYPALRAAHYRFDQLVLITLLDNIYSISESSVSSSTSIP
tara:strand:+ start:295 stop:825 length:531 start_codon:yes stop_codon:yes gene_type:complete